MRQIAYHSKPMQTAGFAHPVRNAAVLGLQQGMSIADFGAGSGAYVFAIAERLGNTGHIYAVDVQRDLLRRIHTEAHKRGFKNIGIIWADLEEEGASKLAEHSLDLVLISNLLFQLDDQSAVLYEAHRVLKPSGQLAVIDWSDPIENASRSNGARSFGPKKQHVVTKEKTLELARKAGFELTREFPAGAHHYGLVFHVVHNMPV